MTSQQQEPTPRAADCCKWLNLRLDSLCGADVNIQRDRSMHRQQSAWPPRVSQ